jgi:hypothetical protein
VNMMYKPLINIIRWLKFTFNIGTERKNSYLRKYRQLNKVRVAENLARRRSENPIIFREYSKKYREKFPDRVKVSHNKWLKKNRDEYNAYQREYKANKKEGRNAKTNASAI